MGSSGFECKGAQVCSDAEKAIAESEIVILPLPATKNGITLSCPLCNDINLTLRNIVNLAIKHRCKAIFGGNLPDEFIRMGDAGGIAVLDYYRNERLLGKNALASAEGALMVTMEHTEITLKGMKVLISGYGRIGSLSLSRLKVVMEHLEVPRKVLRRSDHAPRLSLRPDLWILSVVACALWVCVLLMVLPMERVFANIVLAIVLRTLSLVQVE